MAGEWGTALLGGTVGAFLTQLATVGRDAWNRRRDGKFTALLLALALEDYASECTDPIFELSNFDPRHGGAPEPSGSLPALPPFSDKTDWRSLGVELSAAVLALRVHVATAHGSLANTHQYEGRTSAWGEASSSAIELGSEALGVAKRLRARFKLPPLEISTRFDIVAFYAENIVALQKQRADWTERQKNFWPGEPAVTAPMEAPLKTPESS
jgi:hypothetical protein